MVVIPCGHIYRKSASLPLVKEDAKIRFGQRLREMRKQAGFSQEALAHASGLDRSYVGGIERGEYNISLINICRLADTLGVPPHELLKFSNNSQERRTRPPGSGSMEKERTDQVLRHIRRQIAHNEGELLKLSPRLGWTERVRHTAETFVPRIVASATDLMRHIESSLNSPLVVRAIWDRVKGRVNNKPLIEKMDNALEREQALLSVITGETISKLIADFLCERNQELAQNNRSTYPDLYSQTAEYSQLPKRKRGLAEGPALRGGSPTSVPDGIEIKSNRGQRIRVDCHHDHQGLHLALTFDYEVQWKVYDVYLAYLSKADYKRAERNTTATTDKFSFGQAPFISVTTGRIAEGLLEEATD